MTSEQQILRVNNNRQECCHVAGDIDFDHAGNLWMVTGDDTPAAGIHANGFGPFEDQAAAWSAILEDGVLVRDVGLKGWLRVTAGLPSEGDGIRIGR